MPTENRSSNTEMVSVPREQLQSWQERFSKAQMFQQSTEIQGAMARPAPQPTAEPIAWMVGTAIWWTKEEAERDAADTGLPIVGLGPMTGPGQPGELQQAALAIPDECPHLIVFDDTQVEQLMFAGAGARAAALKKWESISTSWNAHLFVRVARNSRDDGHQCAEAAVPGEVERLRNVIQQQTNLIASLREELVESRGIDASAEPSTTIWGCRLCQLEQPTDRACDACGGKTEPAGAHLYSTQL